MIKFGLNYVAELQGADGSTITVKPPFTVEFDITRNVLNQANVCQLRIFNLNKRNRELLRFNISNWGTFQKVHLKAGYGDKLSTIFFGNISQGWSFRENTNFITQVECYDGGFAFNNSRVNNGEFPAGTSSIDMAKRLIDQLDHVERGKIGTIEDGNKRLSRGNSLNGSVTDNLDDVTGNSFFIDNGVAHVLRDNEYIETGLPPVLINADTGLLNTPILEQTIVRFDMIFEPSLDVGHRVRVRSTTEENFNGDYKIISVKHRGTISDSVASQVITSADFLFSKNLKGVS